MIWKQLKMENMILMYIFLFYQNQSDSHGIMQ